MGCNSCGKNREEIVAQLKPTKDTPLVHPDGTIQYAERAPEIEGYKHHPEDDTKLIPAVHAPCGFRISGLMLAKDGTQTINHVCNHSQCPLRWQRITLLQCSDCEFREV